MTGNKQFGSQSTAEEVTDGLDLSGKTWLITGINSGLGFESARVLAIRGARLVGLARTRDKAAKAFEKLGIDGDSVACDLSDLDSVREAVGQVSALAPLDGVMANAGIMALPTLEQVAGYERQFFTNHVGHFALVTGLLERLTNTGRVVIVSSGAHRMAERGLELDNLAGDDYHPWRMYGRSKLANILFARSLAARFRGTARTANSLHPGVIQTNLGRHIADREAMYERLRPNLKTVEQGAATQCYLATRPEVAGTSGQYFSDCAPAETIAAGQDDELAESLWTKTEAILASM